MLFIVRKAVKGWTIIQKVFCMVIIFATIFIVYCFLASQHVKSLTPPDGYVYPQVPILKGVYILEITPYSALSKVNGTIISCARPGLGTSGRSRWSDTFASCWLKKELNGKYVIVQRKYLLSSHSFLSLTEWPEPYVSKIICMSDGKVYFEREDSLLRKQWIMQSNWSASVEAFLYALLITVCMSFFLFNN